MKSLLDCEPVELTLRDFLSRTTLTMEEAAVILKQEPRTLYRKVKKDHRDCPHYAQWRCYLALIYKLIHQD